MNIRLFRNGSLSVWISSLSWSVYNTGQSTSKKNENAKKSFSSKFEINKKVWVFFKIGVSFLAVEADLRPRKWAATQPCLIRNALPSLGGKPDYSGTCFFGFFFKMTQRTL